MKSPWKERAQNLGIELIAATNINGSEIESQFTFKYKGQECFTYKIGTVRTFCVGTPPFGANLCTTSFEDFIENFEKFIPGSDKYNEVLKKINIEWYLSKDWSDIDIEKKIGIYGTARSKFHK